MSAVPTAGHRAKTAPDERCVVILAPYGQDSGLIARMLADAGIACRIVTAMETMAQALPKCAAAILTTDALNSEAVRRLEAAVAAQPAWSDTPVILLATHVDAASYALLARMLGNVTILQRPLESTSLLTVVRAAVRASEKQYQIRDLLQAAHERNQEIEALNARLTRSMQETHHRIKNNLQVIAALVEMQSEAVVGGGEAAFRRINAHIRSLATIHDLLTGQAKGDANLSNLDAQTMLQRLVPLLEEMAESRPIRWSAIALPIPIQKSAALALLVNELVSNAIKHGTGQIEITLERRQEDDDSTSPGAAFWARLEVCDDGAGFPDGFDPRKAAHTGLELIDSAARWDLNGSVAYENRAEGGARVVVTFPI